MSPLMEQLHDIEGIDPTEWWPLGIGWWFVIGLATLFILGSLWYLAHRRAFNRSWKKDTLLKLDALDKKLSEKTAKETAITLSEYLRRIAVHRYSRQECAGLSGEEWLQWLTARDPKRYNWIERGKPLIDAPYAPESNTPSPKLLKEFIQAVKKWVR